MADTQIRNKIMDFLDTGTSGTAAFTYMNAGFNSLDENPNAQVDTKAYIGDTAATNIVRGYQTQFPFSIDLDASEAPINKIYDVGRNQKTGSDAEADYVRLEVFRPIEDEDGVYAARKFRVSIQVDSITGEGTQIINIAGQLNNVGSFVDGQFDVNTKTFTPLAATATP